MKALTQNKIKVVNVLRENLSERAVGKLGLFIAEADENKTSSKITQVIAAGAAVIAIKEFMKTKRSIWGKMFPVYCKHIAKSFLKDYTRKRNISESSSLPSGKKQNPIKIFVEDIAEWLDNQRLGSVFDKLDAMKSKSSDDTVRPIRRTITLRKESDSRYTILHRGIMIGSLKTTIIGSVDDRIWRIKLIDRFAEYKYPTGVRQDSPYTIDDPVDEVVLIHPVQMTQPEAKAWLKLNVLFD